MQNKFQQLNLRISDSESSDQNSDPEWPESDLANRLVKLMADYKAISDNLNKVCEQGSGVQDEGEQMKNDINFSKMHSLLQGRFNKTTSEETGTDESLVEVPEKPSQTLVSRFSETEHIKYEYTVSDIANTYNEDNRMKDSSFYLRHSLLRNQDTQRHGNTQKQSGIHSIIEVNDGEYDSAHNDKSEGQLNSVENQKNLISQDLGHKIDQETIQPVQQSDTTSDKTIKNFIPPNFEFKETDEDTAFALLNQMGGKLSSKSINPSLMNTLMAKQGQRSDRPVDLSVLLNQLKAHKTRDIKDMSFFELSEYHSTMQQHIQKLFSSLK